MNIATQNIPKDDEILDAIVIGAGFSGLRMLQKLRETGLSAKVIEAGADVGGTWYWNRYPGARTDSESWVYCYSSSKELLQQWDWKERFSPQAEVLEYLQHYADRFDLRRDIRFGTRVVSAAYDEAADEWAVRTDVGGTYRARYLIPAGGVLSHPYVPDFPGIDDFEGETYLTARWPKHDVDFAGKRVVVVGTGATGVQAIPLIAQTAAHLTVLQRTANFVLPARNHTLTQEHRQGIRADYDTIWSKAQRHFFAFAMDPAGRTMAEFDQDEVQKILEAGWETGGFRYLFETFDEIFTNMETNDVVAQFVRNKIRTIVHDPATAEVLCPKGYPIGAKRPPLGHFYYETYNRENVDLVDVADNAIDAITADGIRLTDSTVIPADVIVFATGFDAVTGALTAIDIRGRNGLELREKWKNGPRTSLGIAVNDFPNMLMVCGPQSTTANIPVVVEKIVGYISEALTAAAREGWALEPTEESMDDWGQQLLASLNETVIPRGKDSHSWYFGANMPDKAIAPLFWFGGAESYFAACEKVLDEDCAGLRHLETRQLEEAQ